MTSSTDYKCLLALIDSGLHGDNIKSLKFLCEPYLGTKKSSTYFSSGFEIFDALEKNKKISQYNLSYLCELLHIIGRVDLASLIDSTVDCSVMRYQHVDQFRMMLFKLSEELASEDVSRLRFQYDQIPKRVIIEDGIDLFSLMLQHKALSQTNLQLLSRMLLAIDRHDLLEIIRSFNEDHQEMENDFDYNEVIPVPESLYSNNEVSPEQKTYEGEPMDEYEPGNKKSQDSDSDNEFYMADEHFDSSAFRDQFSATIKIQDLKDVENIPVSIEPARAVVHADDENAATSNTNSIIQDESYSPIEYYKMDADPRGICVIIDNQKFAPDPADQEAVQNLGNREGSTKDSDALTRSFGRLKFKIDLHTDLKDDEIVQCLKKISAINHLKYDCFICCILSHGGENHVFGVNGRKVHLGDIMALFRAQSCPSLARKPKLFFMASCRGKTHQSGVHTVPSQPLFDTDKPQIDFDTSEWVPNEADFLYGYSTVVNHVSYRSKSQGTFYIQELTRVLDTYAHRENLQDLLLRVNQAVSDRIYSREEESGHVVYKQTPAPQHTLRKQLKFL